MMVIIDNYCEIPAIRSLTSSHKYSRIKYLCGPLSCPILVDLETALVKELKEPVFLDGRAPK